MAEEDTVEPPPCREPWWRVSVPVKEEVAAVDIPCLAECPVDSRLEPEARTPWRCVLEVSERRAMWPSHMARLESRWMDKVNLSRRQMRV